MKSKIIIDEFSEFVEKLKNKMKFESLVDTLHYIIDENIYDFITSTNVQQFLNKFLKEKLFCEYSQKNMIKDKFSKKKNKKLF